jgi:hypothetical protein
MVQSGIGYLLMYVSATRLVTFNSDRIDLTASLISIGWQLCRSLRMLACLLASSFTEADLVSNVNPCLLQVFQHLLLFVYLVRKLSGRGTLWEVCRSHG